LAAAQVGWHHPKRASYGHAMIIDPWGISLYFSPLSLSSSPIIIFVKLNFCVGTILAEVEEDKPGVATAPIDMAFLENVRINMPVLDHRRAELYSVYDML
jgi:predicted amidohydrolase